MRITLLFISILCAGVILAYSRNNIPPPTVLDLLTSKEWTYDTLLINPPSKFIDLNSGQRRAYFDTRNSYKGSSFKFEKDGKISYKEVSGIPITSTWKFINNNQDIEIVIDAVNNLKDTFLLFSVQKDKFSYVHFTNNDYNATYVYK